MLKAGLIFVAITIGAYFFERAVFAVICHLDRRRERRTRA